MADTAQLVADIKKLANLTAILERKLERLRSEGVGVEQELMAARMTLESRQEELAQALTKEPTP